LSASTDCFNTHRLKIGAKQKRKTQLLTTVKQHKSACSLWRPCTLLTFYGDRPGRRMKKTFGRTLEKTWARELNKLAAEKVAYEVATCWRHAPCTPSSFASCLSKVSLAA